MTTRQKVFVSALWLGWLCVGVSFPSHASQPWDVPFQWCLFCVAVAAFAGAFVTPYRSDAEYAAMLTDKRALEDVVDSLHAKLEAERLEHARTAEDLVHSQNARIEMMREAETARSAPAKATRRKGRRR